MESMEWAGAVGDIWASEWRRTDRTFLPVDEALVKKAAGALSHGAAPHILDIGCGAGRTSLSLAARIADATITGIDLSSALIAAARSRAAAEPRCRFAQGDATVWTPGAAPTPGAPSAEPSDARSGTGLDELADGSADRHQPIHRDGSGFDLLVSRHGVMFFDDPVAAFAHLRSLARPEAPLVFSCFRTARENVWASGLASLMPGGGKGDPHAPGPFAFADPDRVATILAAAGWRDAEPQPLDFRYVAGGGADPVVDAIDFFTRIGPAARAIRELDAPGRERLLVGLADLVQSHKTGDHVAFPAAAWIWSARA